MPTYEYECSNCGHELEVFQSMTEERIKKCPQCGENKLSRLIGTGGGIIFKGKGFYETDYKKKEPPKNEKKAEKPASCQSDPGSCACAKT